MLQFLIKLLKFSNYFNNIYFIYVREKYWRVNMSAIGAMRIQTLTHRINKCQLQMTLLSQQQQTLFDTSSNIGREYRQLYNQVNGLDGTVSAEYQDALSSKLGQLQEVYFVMSERENDIEEQIKILNTQYQALTKELENVKKYNEESAKKEVMKFS